jgi:hypothetical protein
MPAVVRLEENTLPAVLGVLCDFFSCISFVSAATIICGVGLFSFHQPTFTAYWSGRCTPFLGALLVQVTASAQAAGRMLTVCPDVEELLAVMALRKTILSSVCLYPDCDVAEVLQSENFLRFPRKVSRMRGSFMVVARS